MRSFPKKLALLFVLALTFSVSAFAADIAGKWTSTFATQMGDQHYTYTFVVDGEKLTGTAKNDMGESTITEGTVKGDDVTFVETLKFNDQEIKITYTGKIDGDEIKLHRQVGDFGSEDLVAKRVK